MLWIALTLKVESTNATLDESIKRMKAKGVTYTEPDLGSFQASMQKFYKEKDSKGEIPAGFLDAVNASRPKSN